MFVCMCVCVRMCVYVCLKSNDTGLFSSYFKSKGSIKFVKVLNPLNKLFKGFEGFDVQFSEMVPWAPPPTFKSFWRSPSHGAQPLGLPSSHQSSHQGTQARPAHPPPPKLAQ